MHVSKCRLVLKMFDVESKGTQKRIFIFELSLLECRSGCLVEYAVELKHYKLVFSSTLGLTGSGEQAACEALSSADRWSLSVIK